METEADAGQILLSPPPPRCSRELRGDAKGCRFLLRRVPAPKRANAQTWGRVPTSIPEPFIPVGLRSTSVVSEPTRSTVTWRSVSLRSVASTTCWLARVVSARPECSRSSIDACQAAFARYDVCFLYADVYGNGGKVFFLAGAPVSHEDNESDCYAPRWRSRPSITTGCTCIPA